MERGSRRSANRTKDSNGLAVSISTLRRLSVSLPQMFGSIFGVYRLESGGKAKGCKNESSSELHGGSVYVEASFEGKIMMLWLCCGVVFYLVRHKGFVKWESS